MVSLPSSSLSLNVIQTMHSVTLCDRWVILHEAGMLSSVKQPMEITKHGCSRNLGWLSGCGLIPHP